MRRRRFRARAEETCSWLEMHLLALRQANYRVGAYGAAAKGMVLLQFLLARSKRLGKWVSSRSQLPLRSRPLPASLTHHHTSRASCSLRDGGISFVLDDAEKKQGTYCPGTKIPVLRTDAVADMTQPADPPLAIIILAWNFWPEVQTKLMRLIGPSHNDSLVALLPFPTPRLLNLQGRTVSRFAYRPTPSGTKLPLGIPSTATLAEADRRPPVDCQGGHTDCFMGRWLNKTFGGQLNMNSSTALRLPTFNCKGGGVTARRRPVMLVSHFFNEEMLLPYWIRHHAPMFDHAVLIDYNSTDRSVEIIKREAPPTWRVVPSTQPEFGAATCDYQVMREEMRFPDHWHATLTTTEFIVHADLRGELAKLDPPPGSFCMARFGSAEAIGNDSMPLRRFTPLVSQRSEYGQCVRSQLCGPLPTRSRFTSRWLHAGLTSRLLYRYVPGRHRMYVYHPNRGGAPSVYGSTWKAPAVWMDQGFLLKYKWTPWPDVYRRKSQIGARVPKDGKARGQHHILYGKGLNVTMHHRTLELSVLDTFDLNVIELNVRPQHLSGGPGFTSHAFHTVFHEAGLSTLPRYSASLLCRVAGECSPDERVTRTLRQQSTLMTAIISGGR